MPDTVLRHHTDCVRRLYYITYYFFLCPGSSQGAHHFYPLAQLAMSMADSGPVFTPLAQLQTSALRRRSSCPSIPRSVSICSSFALDSSSEDLSYPGNLSELDIYMSPLFRGVGANDNASSEAAEGESNTPTEVSTPTTDSEAVHCDDSLSETLSNYNFDLTGHEHVPESPEASEGDPEEQSPLVPNEPSNSEESYLPPPTQPSPTLEHSPLPPLPPVPPKMPSQMMPSSMGTRPLQINRSKKTPQPLPGGDDQYKRPPLKSILRTTTQVDLHGAYRRIGSLAERKVHSRGVVPVVPSSLQKRHPKIPNVNAAEVINVHRIIVVSQRVDLSAP